MSDTEESKIRKALSAMIEKRGRFDGENITKYLEHYEDVVELYNATDVVAIKFFRLMVERELRERLEEAFEMHSTDWPKFKAAVRTEFADTDEDRVTQTTFQQWISQPKKLDARALLREFEKLFKRLSMREQKFFVEDKVAYFLEAASKEVRQKLMPMLLDEREDDGITPDWAKLIKVISVTARAENRLGLNHKEDERKTEQRTIMSKSKKDKEEKKNDLR